MDRYYKVAKWFVISRNIHRLGDTIVSYIFFPTDELFKNITNSKLHNYTVLADSDSTLHVYSR